MGVKRYKLFHWLVGGAVQHVKLIEALELADKGEVDAVYDHVGELAYVRYKAPKSVRAYGRADCGGRPSVAAITPGEMNLIAGQKFKGGRNMCGVVGVPGRSKTLGLGEYKRMERMKIGLPAEDDVELALAKLEGFSPVCVA